MTLRGDINLDGNLDGSDSAFYTSDQGTTLGRTDYALGPDHTQGGGHFNAFTGREVSFVSDVTSWHRNRALRTDLGVWTRRDPLGYVDGLNLYGYVMGPIGRTDPMGNVPIGWNGNITNYGTNRCALNAGGGGGSCGGGDALGGGFDIAQGGGSSAWEECADNTFPPTIGNCLQCCNNNYESDPGINNACRSLCYDRWNNQPCIKPADWNRKQNCWCFGTQDLNCPSKRPDGLDPQLPFGCTEIAEAMKRAGAVEPLEGSSKCPEGYYLMAFFHGVYPDLENPGQLLPGNDFHCAIPDCKGRWWHKPGETPVVPDFPPPMDPGYPFVPQDYRDHVPPSPAIDYSLCGYLCIPEPA